MATTQEIKDGKRADLDQIAVDEGLDPKAPEYSKVDDLRAALLPLASDASDQEDPESDEDEDTDENPGGTPEATDEAVDEAEEAAKKAEQSKTVKTDVKPAGHADKFDATGQPIFGRGR